MTRPQEKRFLATQAEAHAFATKQSGTFHRNVKPQPELRRKRAYYWDETLTRGRIVSTPADQRRANLVEDFCPFGPVGARWWVAETFALEECGADGERIIWRADREAAWVLPGRLRLGESFFLASDYAPPRWRTSGHMRRWATRAVFEVTSVACEQRDGTWEWVVGWRKVEK